MKKLITIFVAIAAMATLVSTAFAQAAGPTGGGVQSNGGALQGKQRAGNTGPIGPKILKQLDLTPAQTEQVRALVKDFITKREQLAPAGTKPSPKQVGPLRKQFIEDFAKILTPEQRDKLKTLMAKKKKDVVPPPTGTATGTGAAGTTGGKAGGGN